MEHYTYEEGVEQVNSNESKTESGEQRNVDTALDYEAIAQEIEEKETETLKSSLTRHLLKIWSVNRQYHDTFIKPLLDECSRLFEGKYSADVLALINKYGGSDIYLPVAAQIATTAEAWMIDILATSSEGTRPWGLQPTPVPELPKGIEERINAKIQEEGAAAEAEGIKPSEEEIAARANELYKAAFNEVDRIAKDAAKLQADRISDVLEESRFNYELKRLIHYLCVYPTAFMVGPVYKREPKNTWINGRLEQTETLKEKYISVSPYDVFPAPDSNTISEGDLVWRSHITRTALSNLKRTEGSNDEAIDYVLDNFDNLGNNNTLNYSYDKDSLENKDPSPTSTSYVDALNFFVAVPVSVIKNSINTDIDFCKDVVEIEALIIGDKLIRCNVVDTNLPFFNRPVYATSYRKVPDSIWGKSPLLLTKPINDICNSCVRALVNNLAVSSSFQTAIDLNSIPQGEDVTQIHPNKIWYLQNQVTNSNQLPIHFFSPPSHSNELLGVFRFFLERAYTVAGIPPAMSGGNQTQGAAATAKGLQALLQASSKGIKLALTNVSEDVIYKVVYAQFISNVVKQEGSSRLIYGDANVVPMGLSSILIEGAKDEKAIEAIRMLGNPLVQEILGIEGAAKLLQEYFEDVGFTNDIIPSLETIKKQLEKQAEEQKQPTEAELEMEKIKTEQLKIKVDKEKHDDRMRALQEKLQFEKEKQDRNEQLKREEMANDLRIAQIKAESALETTVASTMGKTKVAREEMAYKSKVSPDNKGI